MEKQEFIDITPKWEGLMNYMIHILQNPKASKESQDGIRAELMDLARAMDKINERAKKNA